MNQDRERPDARRRRIAAGDQTDRARRWMGLQSWNSRITTRRWASPRRRPTRKSSRRTGSWRASTTRTSIRATSPPRRASRRSTRRTRCSAIPDKRRKYDELGANWRDVRTGAAAGPGCPGGTLRRRCAGGAWNINMGGPGGYRTMTRRRDARAVRQRGSVLGLLPHVLRRRRRAAAGRPRQGAGARARRRAATSSTKSI